LSPAVTILTFSLEVAGSNPDQNTSCPEVLYFPQSLQPNGVAVPQNMSQPLPSKSFRVSTRSYNAK